MNVDDRKNKAFIIYSESGPDSSILRKARLAINLVGVEKGTITNWFHEFGKVENLIWKYAEEGAETKYSNNELRRLFLSAFPWMNEDALIRAIFLTNYYAWHEGYEKT